MVKLYMEYLSIGVAYFAYSLYMMDPIKRENLGKMGRRIPFMSFFLVFVLLHGYPYYAFKRLRT